MCDGCRISNDSGRLSQASVHFVIDRASLFTDHKIIEYQVSQCEPHTSISERFVSKLQTNISLTDSFSSSDWLWSMHGVATLYNCWVFFYSQVRNIFPHISLRDLPCHRTKKILFLHQVFLKLWSVVFLWLQQKSWFRTYLCSSPQYPYLFDTLFECNPNTHVQAMVLVLPNQRLSKAFPKSVLCFLSCLTVWTRPHTWLRIVHWLGWQVKHSQSKTVGGSFSARVPRSSAEVHRVFMHHILEDEADGQKEDQGDQRKKMRKKKWMEMSRQSEKHTMRMKHWCDDVSAYPNLSQACARVNVNHSEKWTVPSVAADYCQL